MPVFEYRCRRCGEEFELFLLGASERPRCPACGSEDLQKKVSVPSCSTGGCSPSGTGFS
jgi:putative FmdB family regulatory protein